MGVGPGRRKLEGGKYRTAGEEISAEEDKETVKVKSVSSPFFCR